MCVGEINTTIIKLVLHFSIHGILLHIDVKLIIKQNRGING